MAKKEQTPEEQIAELQGIVDQKTVELNTLNDKFETLQNDAAKMHKDLQDKEAELQDVVAINGELTDQVEKLTKDGATPAKKEAAKPVEYKGASFEYEGQKIGFNYPKTVWKKQPITAEDIAASPTLQAELIAANHGILKR